MAGITYVSMCWEICVTLVQMCPLYLTLFPSRACILLRGVCLSVYIITLCCMFFIAPTVNLPENYFLPVVHCESLFSALLRKLTRALNLSVFGHPIKGYWIICTFWLRGWRHEKGFYFLVSFNAAHCSTHCLYFPIAHLLNMLLIYKNIMRHICVYL